MNTADEIRDRVAELPEALQTEVLDFVEYLAAKLQRLAEEDREDYELAVQRWETRGTFMTLEEVERELDLGD